MAKALELTWVEKLRQWRKRRNVGGQRKDFYLGTGNGKDDRASYERALAKWRIKEAELNAQNATDALQAAYAKWGESLAARDRRKRSPCAYQQTLPRLCLITPKGAYDPLLQHGGRQE